ncbi:hypothetical protein ACHAXR_000088 [Thalassiosira sp. AJA248-18]
MHRRVIVQGRREGWLFSRRDGSRAKISDYDATFLDCMTGLYDRKPHLFSRGTVLHLFSLRRSLRRGAVLETTGRVSDLVINLVNRWRKKEGARGSAPGLSMQQTYTQVRDTFPHLKLYSQAL